jgi:hypothetical protein
VASPSGGKLPAVRGDATPSDKKLRLVRRGGDTDSMNAILRGRYYRKTDSTYINDSVSPRIKPKTRKTSDEESAIPSSLLQFADQRFTPPRISTGKRSETFVAKKQA